MSKEYHPAPVDTSRVRMPQEIEALTEELARNAHEVWAQQRMADSWLWGPQRDDLKKSHPSLVAYEELPESEKVYDRRTAMETVQNHPGVGVSDREVASACA